MADYRKLAIDLIAAGGKFDAVESRLLKKALYADGKISHEEVLFVGELRTSMVKRAKGEQTDAIDRFFLACLHDGIIGNGIISAEEVGIIKKLLVADKRLAPSAKKFLENLKKKATSVAPEFDALLASVSKK
ncbi:hypothetical protein [Zavarzinella formosa]|uniref:hypothetical protein n=1 Tax=Zavarzinella formosa TaxID=360055 RepID=UPI00030C07E8|nr:hypothetical protein [Zavarzinella formosa]